MLHQSTSSNHREPEDVTIVPIFDDPYPFDVDAPHPVAVAPTTPGQKTVVPPTTTDAAAFISTSHQGNAPIEVTIAPGIIGGGGGSDRTPLSGFVTASSSTAAFIRPSAFDGREEWRPARRLRSVEHTQPFTLLAAEESIGGTGGVIPASLNPSPANGSLTTGGGVVGGSASSLNASADASGPGAWLRRFASLTGVDSPSEHPSPIAAREESGVYDAGRGSGAEGGDGGEAVPEEEEDVGSGMRHASDANHEKYLEIVNNCIIHLTRPIENLPRIGPEELKVIGRCITFEAETFYQGEVRKMHYSGLVSTICCETVSLIHVQRFSEKSFQAFMEQKRANDRNNAATGSKEEEMTGNADGPTPGQGSSVTSHVEGGNTSNTNNNNHNHSTSSSSHRPPSPIIPSSPFSFSVTDYQHTGFIGMIVTPTHREKLHEVQEDFLAPFMTFSRKRIHNVQFSIDPSSRFYSLFRQKSKHIIDMQCLRMFVRRYIVHTSQGNNPRNVPLKAFIVCRCNCPKIDDQMLERIAREEIYYLLKLDGEIQRMTARIQQQEVQRQEANQASTDLELRYMMHMRRFAQDTLLVGVLEIFFMFLIILIRWSLWTEVWILAPYLQKFKSSCLMYWFFTVILGFITSAHGRFISPFNSTPHALKLLRIIFCFVSLYWCAILLVMGTRVVSNANLKQYMESYVGTNTYELSQLYSRYHCSGYNTVCSPGNEVSVFCPQSIEYVYAFPCGPLLRSEMQRTVVPVMTVGIASLFLLLLDLFTLYRYSSNRFRQF